MESIKGKLNQEEIRSYFSNTLKFTAPSLAIFFGELALHVDWRIALATASYTLYANLADLFKKIGQGQ